MAKIKPEDRAIVEKHVITRESGMSWHVLHTRYGEFGGKTYKAALKLAHAEEDKREAEVQRQREDYDRALMMARARAWQLMARFHHGLTLGHSFAYVPRGDSLFNSIATPNDYGHTLMVDGQEFRCEFVMGVVIDIVGNVVAYVSDRFGDGNAIAVACFNEQKTDAKCVGVTLGWLDPVPVAEATPAESIVTCGVGG